MRGWPAEEPPRIGLAPLVDVIFLVLAVFLHMSVLRSGTWDLEIDLPAGRSGEVAVGAADLELRIDRQGVLRLGADELDLPQLRERLRQERALDAGLGLRVYVDERGPAGRLVEVLDVARETGALTLSLAIDPAQVPAAASDSPDEAP